MGKRDREAGLPYPFFSGHGCIILASQTFGGLFNIGFPGIFISKTRVGV